MSTQALRSRNQTPQSPVEYLIFQAFLTFHRRHHRLQLKRNREACLQRHIDSTASLKLEASLLLMTNSILIKGGTIVTMDEPDSIVRGDVLIRDGRIAKIGGEIDEMVHDVIEAHGCAVLPGFVQTHIHLCQTLFRGAADDLALIDWLKKRVWRMEAAHTSESIRARS